MTVDENERRGSKGHGSRGRGIEILRCGAQTLSDCLCGHGHSCLVLSPRRWKLGASPHNAGFQSRAFYSHAAYYCVFALVLVMLAAPASAQSSLPAAVSIAGPPEVLVLVYQEPGGQDQVDITYAHLVPHAQASADIDTLTKLSGWPISSRRIKDGSAPLQNRTGAMTSVIFQVPGVVQDSTHTFPVETLARAFRKYKRINAVFFVGPQFQFQGARSYADNDIKVVLDQHDTAYAYQVEVQGQSFGHLPLTTQAVSGLVHRPVWGVLLGIVGLAALAGLAAYLLAARLTPGPKSKSKFDETDAEAEGRLEAGARK